MKFKVDEPLPNDIHLVRGTGDCITCGEKCSYVEINYGIWVCSDECMQVYTDEVRKVLIRSELNQYTSDLESRVTMLEDEVDFLRNDLEELRDLREW
jgi:hypothetical protein